jgi:hypothetical protein
LTAAAVRALGWGGRGAGSARPAGKGGAHAAGLLRFRLLTVGTDVKGAVATCAH